MPKLILIKHARPQVEENVPSHEWKLSEEGRRLSGVLAEQVRAHAPKVIISSDEPKAVETAQIIASALGVQSEIEPGLAEHDRSNVRLMPTREFISMMALLFQRPRQRVLGNETAEQARRRFAHAIDELIDRHGADDFAVVTHGTVLALYAAPLIEADPFQLWRQLGLPSYLIFDRPSLELIERRDAAE